MNDFDEINKFSNLSHSWWDYDGEFKTLHHINPTRIDFIKSYCDLSNKKVVDVGCGGGILSEGLAQNGAIVSGVDLSKESIDIAKLHLHESMQNIDYQCIDIAKLHPHESMLNIDYQCIDIETFANSHNNQFDVLTCMEMLEHVSSPQEILANCAKLLKPGGFAFLSTLNRNLKSYALGVIASEYILKLIPKGTHDYKKFIKPSELNHMLKNVGLDIIAIKGINYNPFTYKSSLSNNVDINYIVCCQKSDGI